MKANKGLIVALVVVALIGVGYWIYASKATQEDAKALDVPPPRAGSPDFGGLPASNIIGSGGPGTPGGPRK